MTECIFLCVVHCRLSEYEVNYGHGKTLTTRCNRSRELSWGGIGTLRADLTTFLFKPFILGWIFFFLLGDKTGMEVRGFFLPAKRMVEVLKKI